MLLWVCKVIVKNKVCICWDNIVLYSFSLFQFEVVSCQFGVVDLKYYIGIIIGQIDDLEREVKKLDIDLVFIEVCIVELRFYVVFLENLGGIY